MGLRRPFSQDIKNEPEGDTAEITHGRLYPNPDTLVVKGYLKEGRTDRCSDYYGISPKGAKALSERRR